MLSLIYLIIAVTSSLFMGYSFYKCLVNPNGDAVLLRTKLYQSWNHAICFFVGVCAIFYYFIKVRWYQINNGATLSLSDIVLSLFFLMSCMGLMPYFLTNITKGIEAILRKILEK